jgi:hypothetical protein
MALPTSTTHSPQRSRERYDGPLAAITDIAAGVWLLKIDQEMMKVFVPTAATRHRAGELRRGQEGTAQVAHDTTVQVLAGASPTNLGPGDWPQAAAGAAQPIVSRPTRTRRIKNYATAGAITLPNPGQDMRSRSSTARQRAGDDAGESVQVERRGHALHRRQRQGGAHRHLHGRASGNGGGTMDVGTYNATEATGCALVAANGFWVLWANGIGSTGTQVAGVVWA